MGKGRGQIIAGLAEAAIGGALDATGIGVPLGQKLIISGGALAAGGIASALSRTPKIGTGTDLGSNKNDTLQGLPIPYGLTTVGFQRLFTTTHAPNDMNQRYLWMIGPLCHGPIEQVSQVYLDDHIALQSYGPYLRSKWDGGQTRNSGGTFVNAFDYRNYVAGWVAYGTDAQNICVMNARGAFTVTGSVKNDSTHRTLTLSTTHPFAPGDCIQNLGGVVGLDTLTGYIVTQVGTNTVQVYNAAGESGVGGGGGTIDYYAPDLWETFFTTSLAANQTQFFTSDMKGRGMAWLVLRLTATRSGETPLWNGNIPRVTAIVNGIVGEDTSSRGQVSLSVSSISAGSAYTIPKISGGAQTLYTATALVTFTAAHQLGEGQILRFQNTGTTLDGVQRVDRVLSDTQIQVFCEGITGTTSAGTANVLSTIDNPAIAVREYLLNKNYGLGAATTELDDTRFTTEANVCDTLVTAPAQDTATFVNTVNITGTTPSGSQTLIGINGNANDYPIGCTILVQNSSEPALNGLQVVANHSSGTLWVNVITTTSGTAVGTVQKQVTQRQFECAGQLNADSTLKENLSALLATCRGRLIYQGGKYAPSIRSGSATIHPLALTPDLIVGPITFTGPGQADMPNVLRATNVDTVAFLDTLLIHSTTPNGAATDITVDQVNGYVQGDTIQIVGVKIDHTNVAQLNGTTTISAINGNVITVPIVTTANGGGGSIRKMPPAPIGVDGQYSQTLYPTGGVLQNPFYIEDGSQLNLKDVEMPLVNNPARAQQLLMVQLREARAALGISVECREAVIEYEVDDLIAVTHPTTGFVNTPFWVTSVVPLASGNVQLGLEGYSAAAYNFAAQDDIKFTPPTTLADPLLVNPPTGLLVTVASSQQRALQVEWTEALTGFVAQYQAQFRVHGTTAWQEAFLVGADQYVAFITDLVVGTYYDVQLRAITKIGTWSPWIEVDNTLLSATGTTSIAQGTVQLDALGNWKATWDVPPQALSSKYTFTTTGFDTDAVVIASGTVENGTPVTVTGSGVLRGQVVYVAIVPFTGAGGTGTPLQSSHIQSTAYEPPPPTAWISADTAGATDTSINVTFNGSAGTSVQSIQWQYSVNGGAFSTLSSAALPQTITVTRQPKAEQIIELKTIQTDGQTAAASYVVQGKLQAMDRGTGYVDRGVPWTDGFYGLSASDNVGNNARSTVTDSRTSALNTHFRYSTDTSDGVLDGAGSPITGGKYAHVGFANITGQLAGVATDSRGAAINNMFRYGTDSTNGVVDGTGSPLTGGARGFLSLDASTSPRLITAVDETANIGQENAGALSKRAGIFFSEVFNNLPSAANYAQTGSGTKTLVTDQPNTTVGKYLLQTSGGEVWLVSQLGFPFNPSKLYRLRMRVRATVNGDGLIYFGWYGTLADGSSSNNNGGYQYVGIAGLNPTVAAGWQEITTWVKGATLPYASSSPGASADPNSPSAANVGTSMVYPLIAMGYPNPTGSGTFECDYFQIEEMDEDASARTYTTLQGGSNLGWLRTVALDSRGSAINGMFRYGSDNANGVVTLSNKQFYDPTSPFAAVSVVADTLEATSTPVAGQHSFILQHVGSSPVVSRLQFGTDGSGYAFSIARNNSGTVADLFYFYDNGHFDLPTSGAISFGGDKVLGVSIGTNSYTELVRVDGVIGLYLGSGGDPANYYDSNTHTFRDASGNNVAQLTNAGMKLIDTGGNNFQVATVASGSTAPTSSTPGVVGMIYIVT